MQRTTIKGKHNLKYIPDLISDWLNIKSDLSNSLAFMNSGLICVCKSSSNLHLPGNFLVPECVRERIIENCRNDSYSQVCKFYQMRNKVHSADLTQGQRLLS